MASINHETREVAFKLVYCGTPMGGKTTNLSYIHSRIEKEQRGDLVSLSTVSDRTLFFDFLPLSSTVINGYSTRFLLYTVPGQVCYNATRQMVLTGTDGIVFVADSVPDRMEENLLAWRGTLQNLKDNNINPDRLPSVLQYNKRDVPRAAPLDYMEYLLNSGTRRLASFEAAASTGYNVFATLNALAQEVLQRFHDATAAQASGRQPPNRQTAPVR